MENLVESAGWICKVDDCEVLKFSRYTCMVSRKMILTSLLLLALIESIITSLYSCHCGSTLWVSEALRSQPPSSITNWDLRRVLTSSRSQMYTSLPELKPPIMYDQRRRTFLADGRPSIPEDSWPDNNRATTIDKSSKKLNGTIITRDDDHGSRSNNPFNNPG